MPSGYEGWGRNWLMLKNKRMLRSRLKVCGNKFQVCWIDDVQGSWFKKLTNLHDRVTKHSQACLNTGIEPLRVTKRRIVLIMKDIKKGGVGSSYRPMACLTNMWKFLTGINGNEI